MIDDDLLNRLADYYSSEFVTLNEPWIRKIAFQEWLERQILRRSDRILRGLGVYYL